MVPSACESVLIQFWLISVTTVILSSPIFTKKMSNAWALRSILQWRGKLFTSVISFRTLSFCPGHCNMAATIICNKTNKMSWYLHGFGCFSYPALQISTRAQIFYLCTVTGSRSSSSAAFFFYIFLTVTDIQKYLKNAHASHYLHTLNDLHVYYIWRGWITIQKEGRERNTHWRPCFPFCVSLHAYSGSYRKEKSKHTRYGQAKVQIRRNGHPAHTPRVHFTRKTGLILYHSTVLD